MTRGHLHAISDRSELYVGLSGRGVMILETVDGRSEVVDVEPGRAVYVPGTLGAPQRQHRHRALQRPCSATPPTPARTTRSSSEPGEWRRWSWSTVTDASVRANPDHRGYSLLADDGRSMIISHDLGTTGDKATLVDATTVGCVAACTATYATDFGPRGKAEQDAEDWWDALCRPPAT